MIVLTQKLAWQHSDSSNDTGLCKVLILHHSLGRRRNTNTVYCRGHVYGSRMIGH